MKTTVELPNELMRSVKVRAAQENRKLKDLLAEVIARGMSQQPRPTKRRRSPKPVTLPGGPLTIDEIERALADSRE